MTGTDELQAAESAPLAPGFVIRGWFKLDSGKWLPFGGIPGIATHMTLSPNAKLLLPESIAGKLNELEAENERLKEQLKEKSK